MPVDPEAVKNAARLLHHAATEQEGQAIFIGMEQDGSHGLVLAIHANTKDEILAVLAELRHALGNAIPSGSDHLERLQSRAAAAN